MNKRIKKTTLTLGMMVSIGLFSSTSFAMQIDKTQAVNKSDICYSGKNTTLDTKFDSIISNLRDYKAKNPKASEKVLNDYAKSLVSQSKQVPGKIRAAGIYTDMDGYVNGYLNSKERELYKNNRFNALLCMSNGKLALQYTESNIENDELVKSNSRGEK